VKTWKKVTLALFAPWTSSKLWMTIIALLIINSLFWTSVWYLYSFVEQWRAQLFYQMFNSVMWTTSMLVLGLLGLQTLAQGWTNTTATVATNALSSIFHKSESTSTVDVTVTEKYDPKVEEMFAERYASDQSYRPPDTVPDKDVETFR
jgi:hypothetical protein